MTGQTIAQAKLAQPDLWHYLLNIPLSLEAQVFYALLLGCVLGMVAHYVRLWASSQIEGSLLDYLFRQHPKFTVLALLSAASWSFGEVSASLYQGADGEVFSWLLVLISGFKNGYTGDSLINKAERAPWSDVQRAAKAVEPVKEEGK